MTYVYDFQVADPNGKDLLGGKGSGLARMTRLGLPVPPGFTVSTEACRAYLAEGGFPEGMWEEVLDALGQMESRSGRRLGSGPQAPLLVSVRSGAKFSMPGMMDTVLNLGMNDQAADSLAAWAGDGRFAWDVYRRFVQTFSKVVLDVPGGAFEEILTELRKAGGVDDDSRLSAEALETATRRFQKLTEERAGRPIPDEPKEQLRESIAAVFESWNNRRARDYRRIHGIADDLGTAANVQMMVFGDRGDDSGTGVSFTRDPATGQNESYGDYLPNAQGEDVVAGIRNTLTLGDLEARHPRAHAQLLEVMDTLEQHYRDMCDIEFTIERDELWILQTRVGKRTAQAAIRIATEMVDEGLIDQREAVLRVEPGSLEQLAHPSLADDLAVEPLAVGVAASPGAVVGEAVFDADRAEAWADQGRQVILVRWETTPDDIHGLAAARGVLTSHGGKTSHAAVVARGMGKPAVTGAQALDVRESEGRFVVGDVEVKEGELVTIDGTTGQVFAAEVPLIQPEPTPQLERLLGWADQFRRLGIRANADTPDDAARAREWGAEGIGLARTEHMFLGERLPIIRRVILSDDPAEREAALDELGALQVADFVGILEAMDGHEVVIRLLDPPLHEFLPDRWALERERDAKVAAGESTEEVEELMATVARWEEVNPMLGLRGVRLGLLMPELYRTQARAALQAVQERRAAGGRPGLEIMVPLVSTAEELHRVRSMLEEEVAAAELEVGGPLGVKIGTMIESPRAALTAGEIAREADFFSFGTNDLTQMTFAFSRDDAEGRFLADYINDGVLAGDPFGTVDLEGVGRLVELATREGKAARPELVVGICGEHGGDPDSIAFFHQVGLDYVSCSPPRVTVARLAAAQAAIGSEASTSSV
ncbi:MAG: pyruvate, phosphate dikinase [Acidimicrobiia bacterium]